MAQDIRVIVTNMAGHLALAQERLRELERILAAGGQVASPRRPITAPDGTPDEPAAFRPATDKQIAYAESLAQTDDHRAALAGVMATPGGPSKRDLSALIDWLRNGDASVSR